jgi:hypothetical protein
MSWLFDPADITIDPTPSRLALEAVGDVAAFFARGESLGAQNDIGEWLAAAAHDPALVDAADRLVGVEAAAALRALLAKLRDLDDRWLRLLACRIGDLGMERCPNLPTRLELPLLGADVGTSTAAPPRADLGLRLTGGLDASLDLELLPAEPPAERAADAAPDMHPSALIAIRLQGKVQAAFDFGAPVPIGAIAGGADAQGSARLAYVTAAAPDALVADALAVALVNLPSPFDLFALGEHLGRGALVAMQLEADSALDFQGEVQLGEALDVLAGTTVAVGITAEGQSTREHRLSLLVEADTEHGGDAVLVEIARDASDSSRHATRLGLEVDASPALAALTPRLLRHTGEAQVLLEHFTELLPPSRLLRPMLDRSLTLVQQQLATSASESDVAAAGAVAHLLPLLRQTLLHGADADTGLLCDDSRALAERLISAAMARIDLAPGSASVITDAFAPRLAEHIDAAQQRFTERVAALEEALAASRSDAIGGRAWRRRAAPRGLGLLASLFAERVDETPLRERALAHVQRCQGFLSGLEQTIECAAKSKLHARWRHESATVQGAAVRQRLRLFPGRQGAQLLFERLATGNLRKALVSETEQAAEGPDAPFELLGGSLRTSASLDTETGTEVALLDIQLFGRSILDADVVIDLDQAGNILITVRTESAREEGGIGERRRVSAVNVFELATASATRRMTFSLSVGHLESELQDREIREFFEALEAERLLPSRTAEAAIEALQQASNRESGRGTDASRRHAELRAWLELDGIQLLRLLQLDGVERDRRPGPLDDELIYVAAVDALVSALQRVGASAERNNLHHFIRTNDMGGNLAAVLIEMRSRAYRRRYRPLSSSAWDVDTQRFQRLEELSDQAMALVDLIQAMREVYLAPIGPDSGRDRGQRRWSEQDFLSRQVRIDRASSDWLRARFLDRGFKGFWTETLRPNTLAFFIALADLALAPGETPPMMASLFLSDEGAPRVIPLAGHA